MRFVAGIAAWPEVDQWFYPERVALAERAGEVSPDGRQRLSRRADRDVDGARDRGSSTWVMREFVWLSGRLDRAAVDDVVRAGDAAG
jgi:hypothetical protein